MHDIIEFYGETIVNLIGVSTGMALFILLLINYGVTVQQILNGIFM